MQKVKNLAHLVCLILYLAVHFLPEVGGADPMGFQWLYVSAMDLLIAGYILFNYSQFKEAIAGIFKSQFVVVYSLYLIWAIASYFYALNPTETLVCLARLVSTFFIFMNLSVLFYKKDMFVLFKQLAFLITLIAFTDALFLSIEFFWQLGQKPFDNIVLSLRSIAYGNKNIRAASVLINVPFILYYILQSKIGGKIFGIISLCLTLFALFILNTRSTFVGLFLIFIIYTVGTFIVSKKEGRKSIFFNLAYFILPILFSFFVSNMVIKHALTLQKGGGGYGTVAKRIVDITNDVSSGNRNARLEFWATGIDYTRKHLFIGDGYGNWKLSSLMYEKEHTNDFVVRYHLHNDFIENFADLGVIGGVLYLGVFLFAFLFTLKIWRNKAYSKYHFAATIALMAISCYFVDAALNFPVERTVMQVMFAISAAFLVAPFSALKKEVEEKNKHIFKTYCTNGGIAILILLLVGSIALNAMVYKSLRLQKYMMADLGTVPIMTIDQVKGLPSIPNLSFNTMPLPAMLARYYLKYKKYDEAYRLLKSDKNANPYLHYNDYVMAQYFAAKGYNDSALIYAKQAFYNWPTANVYYYQLIPMAVKAKDSTEITKAFNTYIKFRNEPSAWNTYLNARLELMGTKDPFSIQLVDSALKQFPNDSARLTKLRSSFSFY
jgi:O-antigen ligase